MSPRADICGGCGDPKNMHNPTCEAIHDGKSCDCDEFEEIVY